MAGLPRWAVTGRGTLYRPVWAADARSRFLRIARGGDAELIARIPRPASGAPRACSVSRAGRTGQKTRLCWLLQNRRSDLGAFCGCARFAGRPSSRRTRNQQVGGLQSLLAIAPGCKIALQTSHARNSRPFSAPHFARPRTTARNGLPVPLREVLTRVEHRVLHAFRKRPGPGVCFPSRGGPLCEPYAQWSRAPSAFAPASPSAPPRTPPVVSRRFPAGCDRRTGSRTGGRRRPRTG